MKYWLLSAERQLLHWANPGHITWVLLALELSLAIHDVCLGISRWLVVLSLWYFSAICSPDRTIFSPPLLLKWPSSGGISCRPASPERTEFCSCELFVSVLSVADGWGLLGVVSGVMSVDVGVTGFAFLVCCLFFGTVMALCGCDVLSWDSSHQHHQFSEWGMLLLHHHLSLLW